jgi:hypothetical protein
MSVGYRHHGTSDQDCSVLCAAQVTFKVVLAQASMRHCWIANSYVVCSKIV